MRYHFQYEENHNVYVFADPCHILKNICGAFMKYDFILPQDVVDDPTNDVETRVASHKHIWALHEWQEHHQLKICPRVNAKSFPQNGFQAMNVGAADQLFDEATAAGLRYLVEEQNAPKSYLTTAYMIDWLARWFALMKSRNPHHCFRLSREDKFQETCQFLRDFVSLFESITFDCRTGNTYKPFQKGVHLTTYSMLGQCQYYLHEKGHSYLLGGRFTTDFVENYFSQVRRRHKIPTCLEFRYAFKALLIIQCQNGARGSSYFFDDANLYWTTRLKELKELNAENELLDVDHDVCNVLMGDRLEKDHSQENALTYMLGYLFKQTIVPGAESACDTCNKTFVQKYSDSSENQKLLVLKCYTPNALCVPNDYAYKLFSFVESSFLLNVADFKDNAQSFMDSMVEKCAKTMKSMFPEIVTCHLDLLLRRFFKIRMIFYTRWLSAEAKQSPEFASMYAAAGHSSASVMGYQKTR